MKMAKKNDRDILFWMATALVAIVVIASSFLIGYVIGSSQIDRVETTPEIVEIEENEDDHFIGDPNAPVTIVEYSDFECFFCMRFYDETLPKLKSEYIDTGKVKLVYKDLPIPSLGHENAITAALGAECAFDQGGNEAYFAMHDLIFDKQLAQIGSPTRDNLIAWAGEIEGIDAEKLTTCIDNNESIDRVTADVAEAESLGFRGTPSFVINGQQVVGAQPYDVFKNVIEANL